MYLGGIVDGYEWSEDGMVPIRPTRTVDWDAPRGYAYTYEFDCGGEER